MNPKISIITICFNAEKFIEQALQSFFSQDYENKELVVIDGASTDKTLSILNRHKSQIDVLVSEPDKGLYDALNKGIDKATGDVIGILHADDLFASNHVLSRVAQSFQANKIEALYGNLNYTLYDGKTIHRKWISGLYNPGSFKMGWMPPHPTFYVKKKLFEKFGNYNTNLKLAADYELMLRFIEKNKINPFYLNETLVLMRVGGASNVSLKNRLKANREDRLAWKMNGLNPPIFLQLLKPLRKISQFIFK